MKALAAFGIIPCRFSAIDGTLLPLETINDCGMPYSKDLPDWMYVRIYNQEFPNGTVLLTPPLATPCFYFSVSRGAVGCALSHISVIEDAYNSGYDRIMVFEDDFKIDEDPRQLPELIEELESYIGKGNWDIFFTDTAQIYTINEEGSYVYQPEGHYIKPGHPIDNFKEKQPIGNDLFRTYYRTGTYSVILSRRGIEKLYEHFKNSPLFFPLDLEIFFANDIGFYCPNKAIISHIVSDETDIQNY